MKRFTVAIRGRRKHLTNDRKKRVRNQLGARVSNCFLVEVSRVRFDHETRRSFNSFHIFGDVTFPDPLRDKLIRLSTPLRIGAGPPAAAAAAHSSENRGASTRPRKWGSTRFRTVSVRESARSVKNRTSSGALGGAGFADEMREGHSASCRASLS